MLLAMKSAVVGAFYVVALALLPAMAPAQTTTYAQRLAALQQQNAFQQQQSAVQNAVQQTAVLAQTAQQQNGMAPQTVVVTPISFLQQQVALQTAIQQTRALLQTGQQRNPALTRAGLGQLNTLQAVLQQSISLQTALLSQSNILTPAQLLMLPQQQFSLSSLLTTPPAPLTSRMSGGSR